MTARHGKIALALGGGGARGLAHLGALEVLHDAGVTFGSVFGVSVGSIVAGGLAFEPDAHVMRENALRYLDSPRFRKYSAGVNGGAQSGGNGNGHGGANWFYKFLEYLKANRTFHRMILGPSLLPGRILEEVVNSLLPDADIADARIPLTVVAMDLVTGREVEITKGPVRRAVLGSASLPGIFPPVEYGGCLLADIGVISAVPCRAARRSGADHVLAIDVTQKPARDRSFHTAMDVMLRTQDVTGSLFLSLVLDQADFVIRPDVSHLEWTNFGSIPDTIERGRIAARESLPHILAGLGAAAADPAAAPADAPRPA
jgi:NTE family protein